MASRAWPLIARLLILVTVGGWALLWGWWSLDLLDSHVEYSPAPAQDWLWSVFRFRREWVDAARFGLLALLPAALVLWSMRAGSAQWISPRRWRPALVLAGWAAAIAVPVGVALLLDRTGIPGCAPRPPGTDGRCEQAIFAVNYGLRVLILCALLAVLWRRRGGLRSLDAGEMAVFAVGGICALGAAQQAYGTATRMLDSWPRHTVTVVAQWLVVLALAVLIERWLARRPDPPRSIPRVVSAGSATFAAFVLFAEDPLGLLLVVSYLLIVLTVMHTLWWLSRPAADTIPARD